MSTQWVRNVSLVKRVYFGFSAMAGAVLVVGGVAIVQLNRQATAGPAVATVGALTLVGCVLALVCAWLINSSIRASVEPTVQSVIRIAGGDLETKIESPGKDEVSWLRGELNSMRKKLRTMVLEVRRTVDGVNTASTEIAQGNGDLSNRTETQSAALQKTAQAMQQLASTVRHNADSTREARGVVTVSSNVAARGAQMMQDVMLRMGEIDGSAKKIAEIIGVIDSIAFQTNILALNAAVEAASAGEHGRGFAVVASEVRNLAQRSSTAAREIKALIDDSSKRVSAGSKIVNEAGQTMQEIVDSVGRVASLIATISEAGQSQSSDIEQVHQAIAQIDSMTQQNAALVEQMAAAALSLKAQADQLTAAMGSFRVVG